jgi:hypothetical protein
MKDFFRKLVYGTQNGLKILALTKEIHHLNFKHEWNLNLEVVPMSVEAKSKLFKVQMQEINKMGLISGIDVKNHPIFTVIDSFYISRIVHQFSSDKDLDYWNKDVRRQLKHKD